MPIRNIVADPLTKGAIPAGDLLDGHYYKPIIDLLLQANIAEDQIARLETEAIIRKGLRREGVEWPFNHKRRPEGIYGGRMSVITERKHDFENTRLAIEEKLNEYRGVDQYLGVGVFDQILTPPAERKAKKKANDDDDDVDTEDDDPEAAWIPRRSKRDRRTVQQRVRKALKKDVYDHLSEDSSRDGDYQSRESTASSELTDL